IVITHKDLTDRAKAKIPDAEHISVENFLNSPKYDELENRSNESGAGNASESGTSAENGKENIEKVIVACDARIGSSRIGASWLKKKFKKAKIDGFVTNEAIYSSPLDGDIVITHKDLTDRAKAKIPDVEHISVENFLNSPKYDELENRLIEKEQERAAESATPTTTPKENDENEISPSEAGSVASAMRTAILHHKL